MGDLMTHILELKTQQAALLSKVESMDGNISQRLNGQDARMTEQSNRVRDLEKASWQRTGAAGVLAAGLTYVASWLVKHHAA